MITHCVLFRDAATTGNQLNIEEYYSVVMANVDKCVEVDIAIVKAIGQFQNQTPWVDRKVRALVMARNIKFKSYEKEAYSVARGRLRVRIREAK